MTGEQLKELRNNKGLTQSECAKILGLSLRTYQNWEASEEIAEPKAILIRNIFIENTDKVSENNTLYVTGTNEDESLYKLAYECISRHDELMTLPEYRNHIEYIVNQKLNTFKNLDELKRYLDEEIN